MTGPSRLSLAWLLLLSVAAVLLLMTWPHYARPRFRYTGSAPERLVWNCGLPFAICIFDRGQLPYLIFGPTFVIDAAVGVGVLLASVAACRAGMLFKECHRGG